MRHNRVQFLSFMVLGPALAITGCSQGGESTAGADDEAATLSVGEARKILQASFDAEGECTPFFDLPHDVARNASYDQQQLQAFVDAGLLRVESDVTVEDPASGSGQRDVVRYGATPEGLKIFRPGSGALAGQKTVVCYGTRKVEHVELGEPDVLGSRRSITYRYRVEGIPAWARSPSIAARYPRFEKFVTGIKEDHGTLIRRGSGWQLEGPPPSDMFDFRQLGR